MFYYNFFEAIVAARFKVIDILSKNCNPLIGK